MKTSFFTLLLLLSCCQWSAAQCPMDITFSTQGQIDSFPFNYPDCTQILGDVTIDGSALGVITNLDSLTQINYVGGGLYVFLPLPSLSGLDNLTSIGGNLDLNGQASLAGLSSLTSVGGDLWVSGNDALTSLSGLDNLTSIGGVLWVGVSFALTSMAGLGSLTSVGGIEVTYNDALTSLSGMDNLTAIGGFLSVSQNAALTSLSGLDNLTSIGKFLSVHQNAALTSLSGLDNLTSIGEYLIVSSNDALTSLSGLESLTSVGDLYVTFNDDLTSLSGLDSLTAIGGYLEVAYNAALTSLGGLDSLTAIGEYLYVVQNPALTSLDGLHNLTSISGNLRVEGNYALTSLSGLDNIDPATITELFIENNPQLFLCDVHSVCDYLENGGPATISGNATGCNSIPEVEAACAALDVFDRIKAGHLLEAFPNPASEYLNLSLVEPNAPLDVQVFDVQGRLLRQQTLDAGQLLDVQELATGMYLLKVFVGERVFMGKFIKN